MSDAPRRRRSEEDTGGNGGGGLPLFPLVLVVIFAGLLLGGVLARFFGAAKSPSTQPSQPPQAEFTIAPVASNTPMRVANASPTASPVARPSVRPSASSAPSVAPSATPVTSPSPAKTPAPKASASPKPAVTGTPRVVIVTPPPHTATTAPAVVTAAPATPNAVAAANTPAPNFVSSGGDQASTVVRSYLGALARGDRATATTYLAHGLPSENFMDASSRILYVRSQPAGNQYHVSADVQTSTGEYYITFTLQQGTGGLQITDHTAIKPQ
ncbi:MAG: hypothetical protein JO029_04485 [Candidatus Eremiobacteraeota bacterium]|nr:hypothetical protein [Candidatus Eremiobacteraeota bacterium]MBV8433521.1 hypothetical protein [Candidatus Eremiobacteraeota bacterium]